MFRRANQTRLDRILAAIEIPALGLWLGALCGFAFIFAPAAFRIVPDVTQFAELTTANLRALAVTGAACGAVTIVVALVRSRDAADRTNDIVRALLVTAGLVLVAYETFVLVPQMLGITDVRSAAFGALHQRSSQIYGGALAAVLAALVSAAVRRDA